MLSSPPPALVRGRRFGVVEGGMERADSGVVAISMRPSGGIVVGMMPRPFRACWGGSWYWGVRSTSGFGFWWWCLEEVRFKEVTFSS